MNIVGAPESPHAAKIEELRELIQRERDSRQVKKGLAVKLVYQGYSYAAIANILDVSMGAITAWKQIYEAEGLEGFRPKHKGRKAYLRPEQKDEVLAWLQTKEIWELSEVEYHLADIYDVAYESKQSYYDLMEAGGLSWKKTSAVNTKKDPEAVAAKKSKSGVCWRSTERPSKEKTS
jgi:putative transposase